MPFTRQLDDESRDSVQDQPPDHETQRLNDADQLRADLKAETGYSSYKEYLDSHQELYQRYSLLPTGFYGKPSGEKCEATCFILDLCRGQDLRVNVNLRCQSSSAAETLTILRHPPLDSSVQILLWSVDVISSDWMSAIGLGLKIRPSFFDAVCDKLAYPTLRDARIPPPDDSQWSRHARPFVPSHLEIDEKVVTIANYSSSIQPRPVPVVLIAGRDLKFPGIAEQIGDLLPRLDDIVDTELEGLPDLLQCGRYEDEAEGYARLLRWCFGNGKEINGGNAHLIICALLPLVYMSTFRVHYVCGYTRGIYLKLLRSELRASRKVGYDEETTSNLHKSRHVLRCTMERSKDDSEDLIRCRDWRGFLDWPPACKEFIKRHKRVHEAAHRLDAEIRDHLQLQLGEMGLRESRKSIEISNLQIEESKRGSSLSTRY